MPVAFLSYIFWKYQKPGIKLAKNCQIWAYKGHSPFRIKMWRNLPLQVGSGKKQASTQGKETNEMLVSWLVGGWSIIKKIIKIVVMPKLCVTPTRLGSISCQFYRTPSACPFITVEVPMVPPRLKTWYQCCWNTGEMTIHINRKPEARVQSQTIPMQQSVSVY